MSPETRETALPGGLSTESRLGASGADCTILRPQRRNGARHGTWREAADPRRDGGSPQGAGGARGLLTATGSTPREAWIRWLAPTFADNDSCYFTGTYSDAYGFPNGLTLPRNVHKDYLRFADAHGFLSLDDRRYILGIERHEFRDILHFHGIIEGPFSPDEMRYLKTMWQMQRGWAKALPVLDGCSSYVTKYALKGDTECFEMRL